MVGKKENKKKKKPRCKRERAFCGGGGGGGGGGGSLEPWSPEIFAVKPRAQSLFLLGALTR